ncbi:MAG: hypothetical protein AAF197_08710, partial [Pseudomonadota bacterium]
MSLAIAKILLPIATELGTPILKRIFKDKIGGKGGEIADKVLDSVTKKIGAGNSSKQVEQVVKSEPTVIREIIREVETQVVDELGPLVEVHSKYLDLLST